MRSARVKRMTREVDIELSLKVDGEGESRVDTKVAFLNHMLATLAKHAYWSLDVQASGDLVHHVVEDVGLALGEGLRKALGEKTGIRRFGYALVPMDDSLARASVDLGGRPYVRLDLKLKGVDVEGLKTEDIEHFFFSFGQSLQANIHLSILYGENDHHKVESAVKALAVAIREASVIDERIKKKKPSVKGVL
ncbi:imidazoleglycerol-phosphate dehydratase HisB [Candidatus Bathyarchaeota archaeon]|nr:imidazoleglycerol-phosphate dehydratase HisB [Candidatus Bathyarchaeota archaeon]